MSTENGEAQERAPRNAIDGLELSPEASEMHRDLAGVVLVMILMTSAQCSRRSNEKRAPASGVTVIAADGRTMAMDEASKESGTARYEIEADYAVPPEAEALHQQAREAGAAGQYPKAIELLDQAAKLAPKWPYPVYDKAFTYLLMKDDANALASYRKTVELAPRGFFTALPALDTLEREAAGKLPVGTYVSFLSLEWANSEDQQRATLERLTQQAPTFAPAWSKLATLLTSDQERLAALDKGLAAAPDAETKGELLINKALLLSKLGERAEAERMLKELIADPGATSAAVLLARESLESLPKK